MYTYAMAKKRDEARTETLSVKVSGEFKAEVEGVAAMNDRTLSQTSYLLIQKGLEAYRKDKQLLPASENDAVSESTRKTNSAFKVYTAELTMAEIAEKLTAETGVKILSEYIVFYRGSLRGDEDAIELFYELPQEVQNIIIAYYDARDSQKEEKTG